MADHCPGCRGYTQDFASECPGITPGEPVITPGMHLFRQYVPRLHWRDRLRVLRGQQVALMTGAEMYGGGGGGGTQ